MTRVPLLRHELLHQALIARTPPDGQSPLDLLLYAGHLLVQLAARHAVRRACGDGVHGGELEEADRLFDVVVLDYRRQGHLRERLGYPDDGLELTERTVSNYGPSR